MLYDVITDVVARYVALSVTTEIQFGKHFLKQHARSDGAAGDRIVIIPNEDTFGGIQSFNGSFNPSNASPRPLMTRSAGAEVHCWGAPGSATSTTAALEAMGSTETILHVFLREFYHVTRGCGKRAAGRWNNEVWDLVYGAEYILQVSVDIPVVDRPKIPLPLGSTINTTFTLGQTNEVG